MLLTEISELAGINLSTWLILMSTTFIFWASKRHPQKSYVTYEKYIPYISYKKMRNWSFIITQYWILSNIVILF